VEVRVADCGVSVARCDGVSHHVHFFADFLNVIQREGKFGAPAAPERLPRKMKKSTFSICTVYSPGAIFLTEK